MKVTLVADTRLAPEWTSLAYSLGFTEHEGTTKDADLIAEHAGRNCYQSWNKASGKTNKEYLGNIIKQGHFSVLEHASVTFHVSDVSRSLLTELTRHRHFSFSVQSQRFVDETGAPFIIPPDVEDLEDRYLDMVYIDIARATDDAYEVIATYLMGTKGWDRKKARSAARAVLPNGTETSIVITGNHRAWREAINKRLYPGADREIRDLAGELLTRLKEIAPNTYQDMP